MRKGSNDQRPMKISANEINRFMYCPYQWYYGRYYGQKALKEKYQALEKKEGPYEGNFRKGLHFHEKYYRHYKWKRRLEIGIVIIFILLLAGSIVLWKWS